MLSNTTMTLILLLVYPSSFKVFLRGNVKHRYLIFLRVNITAAVILSSRLKYGRIRATSTQIANFSILAQFFDIFRKYVSITYSLTQSSLISHFFSLHPFVTNSVSNTQPLTQSYVITQSLIQSPILCHRQQILASSLNFSKFFVLLYDSFCLLLSLQLTYLA